MDLTLANYSIACLDCQSSQSSNSTHCKNPIKSTKQLHLRLKSLKSSSSQVKNVKIPSEQISVKVPPCCPHQSHSSQPLPPCPWNPPGARASRGSVPEATHIGMPKVSVRSRVYWMPSWHSWPFLLVKACFGAISFWRCEEFTFPESCWNCWTSLAFYMSNVHHPYLQCPARCDPSLCQRSERSMGKEHAISVNAFDKTDGLVPRFQNPKSVTPIEHMNGFTYLCVAT